MAPCLRWKKWRSLNSPAPNLRWSSPWRRLAIMQMVKPFFRSGQADSDLYIVESGQVEIRNSIDDDRLIVTHEPGQFSGAIEGKRHMEALVLKNNATQSEQRV